MGDLILVTGGAGYVGSHLTRKLLARGHRVRVLDNFVYGNHGLDEVMDHPDLELRSATSVTTALWRARPRARARSSRWRRSSATRRAISIRGARWRSTTSRRARLLDACRAAGVERLVFASSCSVYGANGNDVLHEDSHLNPVSLYARTRIMSEELLLNAARRRRRHPPPRDGVRRVAAHALRSHGQHDDRLRRRRRARSASAAPSSGARTCTCRMPPRRSDWQWTSSALPSMKRGAGRQSAHGRASPRSPLASVRSWAAG